MRDTLCLWVGDAQLDTSAARVPKDPEGGIEIPSGYVKIAIENGHL